MFKSKNILVLALTICLVMGMFSFGFAAEKTFLALATGGTGGTYYPLGGALAQMLSNFVPDLIVTAQTSPASVASCNLIGRGQVEMAFSQANTTYWSYSATGILEGQPAVSNLRGIASLYPETIQLVATKKSGIKSYTDLKGKRVGVGAPNSGTEADARLIVNAHGLTWDDMTVDYISFTEVAQQLVDGHIDAGFVTAGIPTSSVMEIAIRRELVIVPISEEKIKELVETIIYYGEISITAGTYEGQDEPVMTVATPALWVCDAKLSPDLVYKMTKALWEHRDVLEKVHAKGKDVTLETALDGMGIPLHPGAELYYKEVGLIK